MPIVAVDNLSKTYEVSQKDPGFVNAVKHFFHRRTRSIEAVKEISFDIAPGEMVGFLGPNGAGKTTALKMLTGLIHPTSGGVDVLGFRPFDRRADFLRQITLVMGQKQQLIWDLPAIDSMRINAAVYDIPEADYRQRLDQLTDLLEMREQLTQPVRKLSLGQRMKAELIAALLHHPKVLFLDEPTLGLDVNAQATVRNFVRQYNAEHEAAVLLTSHYMADITALCKRVIIIHEGEIMYDGRLDAIVERFAPYREVKLELESTCSERDLSTYGEVESCEDRAATLIVRREALTATISRIMNELPVADLTISDPPIEEVIGKAFNTTSKKTESRSDEETE